MNILRQGPIRSVDLELKRMMMTDGGAIDLANPSIPVGEELRFTGALVLLAAAEGGELLHRQQHLRQQQF